MGPRGRFYSCDCDWDRLCIPGRDPRTKETLPDFRE